MFIQKAEQYARRGLVMAKRQAEYAYTHGRNILSKVDNGFQIAKKVHKALTGLVDNKLHQRAQKALSDFESVDMWRFSGWLSWQCWLWVF